MLTPPTEPFADTLKLVTITVEIGGRRSTALLRLLGTMTTEYCYPFVVRLLQEFRDASDKPVFTLNHLRYAPIPVQDGDGDAIATSLN